MILPLQLILQPVNLTTTKDGSSNGQGNIVITGNNGYYSENGTVTSGDTSSNHKATINIDKYANVTMKAARNSSNIISNAPITKVNIDDPDSVVLINHGGQAYTAIGNSSVIEVTTTSARVTTTNINTGSTSSPVLNSNVTYYQNDSEVGTGDKTDVLNSIANSDTTKVTYTGKTQIEASESASTSTEVINSQSNSIAQSLSEANSINASMNSHNSALTSHSDSVLNSESENQSISTSLATSENASASLKNSENNSALTSKSIAESENASTNSNNSIQNSQNESALNSRSAVQSVAGSQSTSAANSALNSRSVAESTAASENTSANASESVNDSGLQSQSIVDSGNQSISGSTSITSEGSLSGSTSVADSVDKLLPALDIVLTHNVYIYQNDGITTLKENGKNIVLKLGKTIHAMNNGQIFTFNGKKFYQIGENEYVKVNNTLKRKVLIHNAFVYTKSGKAIKKGHKHIVLKKKSTILALDNDKIVTIKGKKFYRIGNNKYVKVANVKKD